MGFALKSKGWELAVMHMQQELQEWFVLLHNI